MGVSVDLATELGEGFVLDPFGVPRTDLESLRLNSTGARFHERHSIQRFDDAVSKHVSSAYLACGMHSGDPVLMRRVASALHARGIQIGAHTSYPDGFHFGQRRVEMADDELEAVILYQLGGLSAVLKAIGTRIRHVKCHGALQYDVSFNERFTAVLAGAIRKFDAEITVVLMAQSPGIEVAKKHGLRVAGEGYADRSYEPTGQIVSINRGPIITDPAAAAAQVLQIVRERKVRCIDGTTMPFAADSICLHSDTPNGGAIAAAVAAALGRAGVAIAPVHP